MSSVYIMTINQHMCIIRSFHFLFFPSLFLRNRRGKSRI